MCDHNTTTDNSSATSKDNLDSESVSYFYQVNESWNEELGIIGANLFGLIDCLSTKLGHCTLKTATMAKKLGLDIKTIEKHLKILQDKKWIFRNTYSIHKGSKRYIVTQRNARRYWDVYLNKPCVPDHVKDKFLDWYNLKSSPKIKEKFTPLRNGGSYEPPLNGGSLLLRNNLDNKRDNNNAAAPSSDLKEPKHKQVSKIAEIPQSDQEMTIHELTHYFKNHPPTLIKEYVTTNWDTLKEKNNPAGYGIRAIQAGVLEKTKKMKEQKQATTKTENTEEDNKRKSQRLKNQYDNPPGVKIVIFPASIRCEIDSEWQLLPMERTKEKYSKEISFRDPNFQRTLMFWEVKINESLRV